MSTTFDDPEPFSGEEREPYLTQMYPSLRNKLHKISEVMGVPPERILEDALVVHLMFLNLDD